MNAIYVYVHGFLGREGEGGGGGEGGSMCHPREREDVPPLRERRGDVPYDICKINIPVFICCNLMI